jgi:hypothetical protein
MQEPGRDGGQDDTKPNCPPADAEPPEAAAAHLFGRAPDALWRYRNAAGALTYCVCRWDVSEGRKEIRPLSWFADKGWRFAHWPGARPVYNLNRIAAERDAPIVVTDGEKAGDSAARVFPDAIATTSSGGASAVAKTDWTPLAGRRALIWPDADEAGASYAREVAATLAELDCEVSILDADALAAIDPKAGAREPQNGWDAADALAEWPDIAALRNAVAGLAKPFDPGVAYLSLPPYTMDAGGLVIDCERGRGAAKTIERVWISAPFEILGACRDPRGAGWGKMLRWRDGDGRPHVHNLADAALHGEPAALCGALADAGLRVDPARQRDFRAYLAAARPKRRVTVVPRTGWHDIGGQSVFVLPGQTISRRAAERIILDAADDGLYEKRGTLENWLEGPATLASGHVLPVLAMSASLAGPLAYLTGYEGGGLNFVGPSSIGKTTLLNLAASVWGPPRFVRAWRATANGLEGAAAGATDTVLILDELGQIGPREFGRDLHARHWFGQGARPSRRIAARSVHVAVDVSFVR